MGIKNLNKFLREKTPEIFEPIHLSEYAFKKVAIDMKKHLKFLNRFIYQNMLLRKLL
jgi:hypothetical protein